MGDKTIVLRDHMERIRRMDVVDIAKEIVKKDESIAELEAVIKLQKGAIAAKDKSSRQQIKKIAELEAALRAINIYSRNTPGGTSSELERIARKALK